MHWLLALVGAVLGSMAGGIDETFVGLVAGAMIGWQGSRIAQLRRRIDALESRPAERVMVTPTQQVAATPTRQPVAVHPATPSVVAAPGGVAPPIAPQTSASQQSTDDPSASREPGSDTEAPAAARESAPLTGRAVFESRDASPAPMPPAAAQPRRPTPQPAMPRAPAEPSPIDRAVAAIKHWFLSGNVPVKIGMLVLFFGVAAALKYAVDQGYVAFPIELRLAVIAGAAALGLVWGWRNRTLRPAFGLSLQGGAIGVLLLTIFSAYRLYGLLPPGIAFALVVVLVAGAAMLAVLQNAPALAVLGFVGGYLAPVLISTGSGNHVALFSYYAVLNAAVFGIAWKRPWRALNLLGFAFTFIVGTLWGARYYRPEHFGTVEPFLVLFFLFYVAIAVLYALRGPDQRKPLVDGTLVFGTPIIAFALQAALLRDDQMGLAYSALAVAFLYALLARWLWHRPGVSLLAQSYAALAIGFATLAVPLALSPLATSASWALEGAALVWLGLRQRRWLPQFTGWALQGLAGIAYCIAVFDHGGWARAPGEIPILNGHELVILLMAGAAFFISWLHERAGSSRLLVWLAFALGSFWWFEGGIREMIEHFGNYDASVVFVAFSALTTLVAAALRGLLRWPRFGYLVLAMALSGLALALLTIVEFDTALSAPTASWWLGWFVTMGYGLWRLRGPEQRGISIAHVATLATAAFLYGCSLHEEAVRAGLADGWRFVALFLPLIALLFATWRAPALGAWPLADRFDRYRMRWFAPALFVLGLAWFAALAERGGSEPLPYLPLVNPVELFQVALLLVAAAYLRRRGESVDALRVPLAGACFLLITFAGLRAVHHYTGVAYTPAILDDRIAQATLTVLWSIAGVAAWIYGSRRQLWNVWLTGAVLMGVVLAKLVIIDRQYVGNLAGIVSFMAVGALLVLVGRIAPTPPRSRESEQPEVDDLNA